MAASDFRIITIIVPNPQFDPSKSAKIVTGSNLAFGSQISNNFQTLSSNNPNSYDTIEGLLYVPTLNSRVLSSVCSVAQSLIPANVTTVTDFPANQQYPLTAIFPWTNNTDCTQAFLAQTRADAVRGALTFQPGVTAPPSPNDGSWWLNDNGHWKTDNQYPIYAIASDQAALLLTQLALYSGNMTSAPNGNLLAQQYDPRDFPRIFAHVDLQGGTNVPSLWIFLIIVLAVLLGIVIVASIVMHIVQRHQRRNLQRRLERGEVDLESLGIKKMNVPQLMIDKMPKYVYTDSAAPAAPATTTTQSGNAIHPHPTSFSQTTCPICLDDFCSNETEVRELPCKHIFHPECIDIFLRDNSSLCPMCKKSALPPGYCPVKVTNLMVRRERLVRRMRERRQQTLAAAAAAAARAAGDVPRPATRAGRASLWVQQMLRVGQGTPSTPAPYVAEARRAIAQAESTPADPAHAAQSVPDVEMGHVTSDEPARSDSQPVRRLDTRRQTMAVPDHIAAQGAAARRAWRRERLARQEEDAYNRQAETARNADVGRPLWRRVVSRIAPGMD